METHGPPMGMSIDKSGVLKQQTIFDSVVPKTEPYCYGNYCYAAMLKMLCMTNHDIFMCTRELACRIPTLGPQQIDTHTALINQGKVIETIMSQTYPLDAANRHPELLWRMRVCMCRMSDCIQYIYAVSRGHYMTKRKVVISRDTDLDRRKLQFCLESSKNLAHVLIGVWNSAVVTTHEEVMFFVDNEEDNQ